MRSTAAAVLAVALLAGCRSPEPAISTDALLRKIDGLTVEVAELFLSTALLRPVTCDFKSAPLDAILFQLSDQTGASFALDPKLGYARGPARLSASAEPLAAVLGRLEASLPETRVERWRGVLLVVSASEPPHAAQSPLLSDETSWVLSRRLDLTFSQTPLVEVCRHLEKVGARWAVDPSIADRGVTARLHEIPMCCAIEVICRMADCKVVSEVRDGAVVNVLEPATPPPPAEPQRKKT